MVIASWFQFVMVVIQHILTTWLIELWINMNTYWSYIDILVSAATGLQPQWPHIVAMYLDFNLFWENTCPGKTWQIVTKRAIVLLI